MKVTSECCMFCRDIRGLGTGWVWCARSHKPPLVPTARREGGYRPATQRTAEGLQWRESLVDLVVPRPCFVEPEERPCK
jgi:hypothetical protein